MAVRADQDLIRAIIKTYTVKTGGATTAGLPVKFGTTDTEVDTAGTADAAVVFGTALATKAAGQLVEVCPHGVVWVPVKVGTGGSTRGVSQKLVADGYTDITSGTDVVQGRAIQSGVVGDLIGMMVGGGK